MHIGRDFIVRLDNSPVGTAFFAMSIAILLGLAINLVSHKLTTKGQSTSKADSPGARLQSLLKNLSTLSAEMDEVLTAIAQDMQKRKEAIDALQYRQATLTATERELLDRVENLKAVPLPAAEYFNQLNQQNMREIDRRSGKRDILFFVMGVLCSGIVSLAITLLRW